MARSKHVREIQQAIANGYKLGLCDIDGVSYTKDNGEVVKKSRTHVPSVRMRFSREGVKSVWQDGEWVVCES